MGICVPSPARLCLKFITTSFIPVNDLRTDDFTNLGADSGRIGDDGSNQWEIENNVTLTEEIDTVVRNISETGWDTFSPTAKLQLPLGGNTPDLTLDFTNYGGSNPGQDTLGKWFMVVRFLQFNWTGNVETKFPALQRNDFHTRRQHWKPWFPNW